MADCFWDIDLYINLSRHNAVVTMRHIFTAHIENAAFHSSGLADSLDSCRNYCALVVSHTYSFLPFL